MLPRRGAGWMHEGLAMVRESTTRIPEILRSHQQELLDAWLSELSTAVRRVDLMSEAELRTQCQEFLHLLGSASQDGDLENAQGPAWSSLREMLAGISRSRALQGFTPRETALFIFSFKRPLF